MNTRAGRCCLSLTPQNSNAAVELQVVSWEFEIKTFAGDTRHLNTCADGLVHLPCLKCLRLFSCDSICMIYVGNKKCGDAFSVCVETLWQFSDQVHHIKTVGSSLDDSDDGCPVRIRRQ